MDRRDWSQFLFPYEQAVEELKVKFKTLRSELKKTEEFSPIEFVTGRVKRVSSILDKAKRLNVPSDQLEQKIEDIAGIRIMCQFVEDIYRVAEMIRERQDMTVVYEKDYITNMKESGYRSYHLIVEYPVQTGTGMKRVLAELQVRTLAMNFWATIEHSLNYKYKQSLPDDLRIRLKKAADAAYVLDEEMSSIRAEIVGAQKQFENNSNVVSRVLSGIQELYAQQHSNEAATFQMRFSELWENEDVWRLKQLEKDIEDMLDKLKRDED